MRLFYFLCCVKVLILHQHFNTPYTGGAIRSYYLAKALADRGIETVVITARNSKSYQVETIDGIEVHYLPIRYHNHFGFYKRSLAFMRYAWSAVKRASTLKNTDVCYAISVPLTVGAAALKLKKCYGIPFLFEVGDLWPEAPIQMGFIKNKFFRKYLFMLEKKIYDESEAVVALSGPIQRAIEDKVKGKNVQVLPNMSDTEYFKPETKIDSLQEKFGTANQFVVSYIGAVGYANGLEHFLQCAAASEKASLPIKFLLCGEGGVLADLKNLRTKLKLSNFLFIPFTNREGVKEVLNVTDAAFISYRPVPVLETGSPNKYFDGLAAGKLIVVNFGGWIKEEIEQTHCGVYISPSAPEDFVKKIKPFIDDRRLLKEFQQSARQLAESAYSRQMLSKRFVDFFSKKNKELPTEANPSLSSPPGGEYIVKPAPNPATPHTRDV